jgi:hypothetical protein
MSGSSIPGRASGVAGQVVGELRRAVVGAGRRVARVQAGVMRFQQTTVKVAEQQVQAALAVQRVSAEVGADLLTRWQQRWIDGLERFARP